MNASSDRNATTPHREQIEHVVGLLEVLYRANGRMADELDRLASSRASVSEASVARLLRLAEDLRPGASARTELARLDQQTQVAGAAQWIARRRQLDPDSDLLPGPLLTAAGSGRVPPRTSLEAAAPPWSPSAIDRARARWHGQAGLR